MLVPVAKFFNNDAVSQKWLFLYKKAIWSVGLIKIEQVCVRQRPPGTPGYTRLGDKIFHFELEIWVLAVSRFGGQEIAGWKKELLL